MKVHTVRRLAATMALSFGITCGVPALAGAEPEGAGIGGFVIESLTNDSGTRQYQVYTPPGLPQGRPMIVWLHGASNVDHGDPQELSATSTLITEAARSGYSVVAPMQSLKAERSGAWQIFDPRNSVRGQGETSIIADIVRRETRKLGSDADRVYIAGHSAGGAMAENLTAVYPERFAAVAVSAGFPYLGDPTGGALRTARRGMPIPTFVVHGDRDRVSPYLLGQAIVNASAVANGVATTPRSGTEVIRPGRDRYVAAITTRGRGQREIVLATVHGADHPSGPGGLTVNGPDLDLKVIDFLLSKHR